jgi:hypothetical protein
MTLTAPRHRPAATTRRFGYVVAVLINAVLLYAANVWPGWEAVPFLTADTALVMGLVNASIIVSLAANAAYLITDPPWFKDLGTVLTSAVGFVATARIWKVFPFDFTGSAVDWTVVVRIMLVLGLVGSAIGVITGFVAVVRSVATRSGRGYGAPHRRLSQLGR